jgi:hypothetical protein
MIPPRFFDSIEQRSTTSIALSLPRLADTGDKGGEMSRNLPPHPNLDHLRKQAKELLPDLVASNPAAKLADAQHALARRYGFASWPRLKAHVVSLPAAERPHPFTGTWTANLSKSQRHPANPFKAATLEVDVTGDTVRIAHVMISESGHEDRGRNTFLADGIEHPSASSQGYAVTARWSTPRLLEFHATRHGEPVGWGSYEVSADGRTLTMSADQQAIVLDRF